MKIYNSLSRKIEEFTPLNPPHVGMYTCGPTVYDYATIGNFRTYTTADLLYRTLKFVGYDVSHIMNFTDVGHLTGDNLGDADTGEDRLEKAAKRDRKTAWEVAEFYSQEFIKDYEKLNLIKPEKWTKATEHIDLQIELVKRLQDKGLTYKTSDGIYFDTVAFENQTGKKYGELSNLDQIQEGARVEPNPEKKNPRDFALWKFSPEDIQRDMEWDSEFGKGFPGWHIECSAMSMKYLGDTLDIHVGGEDLKSTHHPNEIAQSEGATGKKFVNYWVHGAFLRVDGGRMGKSLGNAYTISDIIAKGIDPLALRYFYLTAKYRETLNFTWTALDAAQNALNKLHEIVRELKSPHETNRTELSEEKMKKVDEFNQRFLEALENDLNMPQALSVLWESVKSNIPSPDKLDLLYTFDEIFGLNLRSISAIEPIAIPEEIKALMTKRDTARQSQNYEESDNIRKELEEKGYFVKDTPAGTTVIPKRV